MTALAALSHAIRTTLILALVGLLAFGSLAGPAAAATGGHHASPAAAAHDHDEARPMMGDHLHATVECPAQGATGTHDMDDGSCCVGTCTTILDVAPAASAPAWRIVEIAPSDHPVLARSRTVEFLRPPSLNV